jgi:hypothetical protein
MEAGASEMRAGGAAVKMCTHAQSAGHLLRVAKQMCEPVLRAARWP